MLPCIAPLLTFIAAPAAICLPACLPACFPAFLLTNSLAPCVAPSLLQFIAGTLSEPLPPAPPLHVEQQLRDAQYALAAADCAQLALMLANERLRALCYADTLAALRDEQAAVTAGCQQGQTAQKVSGEEAGSIAAAVERVSALLPDGRVFQPH